MLSGKEKKDVFWRNVKYLISGTVVAQLIPFLLQPILRRLYSPEEFGLFTLYFSIVSILSIFVTMNYQNTISLPRKDSDGNALVMGNLLWAAILSVLVFAVFLLFHAFILHEFHLPNSFKKWIWFLPLSTFLSATHLIFSNWLIRKKAVGELNTGKIAHNFSEGVSQMSLGYKWSQVGLIGGTIVGDGVGALVYLIQFFKSGGRFGKGMWKKSKFLLLAYRHYPMVGFGPFLFNAISAYIPIFLVASLFSPAEVGQFDLSRQILALPLAIVSAGLSQVLMQKFSSSVQMGISIFHTYIKVKRILWMMAILMVLFFSLWGVPILKFLFGNQWEMGGQIVRILVWSYAIKLTISPLSILFATFGKLTINAIWQTFYFSILILLYLVVDTDLYTLIYILVVVDVFAYLIYGWLIRNMVRNYEQRIAN